MRTRTIKPQRLGLVGGASLLSLLFGYGLGRNENQAMVPVDQVQTTTVKSKSQVVNPAGFYKYGFPGPIHDIRNSDEFISCYNRKTRNPEWVVEHLTKESLISRGGDRKNSVFKEDESIPEIFRGKLVDYFRSGYDRGHQAPAADAKFSQEAMDQTFILSNIAPQVGEGFNRDYWAHLEAFVRTLPQSFDSVRVVTGPLYLPKKDSDNRYRVSYEVIGSPPSVAVPTHFYKLIVGEKEGSLSVSVGAFVLPNTVIPNSVPLKSFQVPVETLESASGLNFLQNVPNAQRKQLCTEVKCDVLVRDFSKASKQN